MNETLNRYSVNMAVITEASKKLKNIKKLKDYAMLYSMLEQSKNANCGVAMIINKRW